MSEIRDHIAAFRDIVDNTSAPQFRRLADITEELISLHRRLALLIEAESKGKIEAFYTSTEPTVAGRDRYASAAQIDNTSEIIRLKGCIAAYECERDYLHMVIQYA